MLLKMAFRNIFRQKKRNILTLSVMIFGLMLAIFYDGMIQSVSKEMFDIYIDTELGQYKIYGNGFYSEKDDNEQIEFLLDDSEFKDVLTTDNYTKRLVFPGNVNNGIIDYPVQVFGVDRDMENQAFNREDETIKGDFLKGENEIVIGKDIADVLKVDVGDYVTIIGRTIDKSINARDFQIGGIYKSLNTMLNKNATFIHLDDAKQFLNTDKINDIAVVNDLSESQKDILKKTGDVISWEEELEDLISLMKYKGQAAARSVLFIVVIAGIGIANTMLMSTYEREKEIGMMMANGMSNLNIMLLFIYEGLFLGLFGSSVGVILGIAINAIVKAVGIPLPLDMYEEIGMDMVMPERMYSVIDLGTSFQFFVIGVLISVIATFYAAYKSTKFNPVDILKN